MAFLAELWLPIVLSSVLVFVVSSIIHMATPLHKGDYKKLPREDAAMDAVRGAEPGTYAFPRAESMKEMSSPDMIAKYERGPVGYLILVPSGKPAMPKQLIWWFVYSLIVGVFVAYVGRLALAPGAEYMRVFRITGTVAVVAYAVAQLPDSIWKGQRWGMTAKFIVDGVIYGLLTAGAFGWLWPEGM